MNISISLTPHLEQFVHEQLANGRFQSENDAVLAGLELLEAQSYSKEATVAWLKQEIDKGLESRPSEPVTPAFWAGIRDRLHAESAARAMALNRIIHKTGLATADLNGFADYYREQAGLNTALRFVECAAKAFAMLVEMPKIGPVLGLDGVAYEDLRRWHIKGFDRLIIIYRETLDGVEIVRVLHTSRDIAAILRDSLH